jgi:hypothetical protein
MNRRVHTVVITLSCVLAFGAAVACSSSSSSHSSDTPLPRASNADGGGGGTDTPASLGDASDGGVVRDPAAEQKACQDSSKAYCEKIQTCEPTWIASLWGDLATCESRLTADCTAHFFSGPGTSLTPARWEACAAATASKSCAESLSFIPFAECQEKPGALPAGSPCLFGNQCATARCKLDRPNGCGTCVTISPANGACQTDDDCDVTAACSPAGVCVPYGTTQGASCDANHPCDGMFVCKGGTCQPLGTSGMACTANSDCVPYSDCGGNHACDTGGVSSTSGCGWNPLGTQFLHCPKGFCHLGNDGRTGTCIPSASDGQRCDPANDLYCTPPARCVGGTCVVVDPATCH